MSATLTIPEPVPVSLACIDRVVQRAAEKALCDRFDVPSSVNVSVMKGIVRLAGPVAWPYQKFAAERAVKSLMGVLGVENSIVVNPSVSSREVQYRIVQALYRHVGVEVPRIHVDTEGRTVTLSGRVRSWRDKNAAERAAWSAAGVAAVRNRIDVTG
jgi:osmotically-inducible protein OsmY